MSSILDGRMRMVIRNGFARKEKNIFFVNKMFIEKKYFLLQIEIRLYYNVVLFI